MSSKYLIQASPAVLDYLGKDDPIPYIPARLDDIVVLNDGEGEMPWAVITDMETRGEEELITVKIIEDPEEGGIITPSRLRLVHRPFREFDPVGFLYPNGKVKIHNPCAFYSEDPEWMEECKKFSTEFKGKLVHQDVALHDGPEYIK